MSANKRQKGLSKFGFIKKPRCNSDKIPNSPPDVQQLSSLTPPCIPTVNNSPLKERQNIHSESSLFPNSSTTSFELLSIKRQPILNPFPAKKCGNQLRRFIAQWYTEFPWLDYDEKTDKVFCYDCCMSIKLKIATCDSNVEEAYIKHISSK